MRVTAASLVACLFGLWLPASAETRASDERTLFLENFDSELDPGWRWVSPVEERRRLEGGRLRIRTAPGGMHADDDGLANLLIRALPDSEERICIDVDLWSTPVTLYENAGLILYLDDDSYVRVNKESYVGHLDPPIILQVVSELEGEFQDEEQRVDYERDLPVSLRMRIDPETVTAFYRRAREGPWVEYGSIRRPVAESLWIGVETSYGEEGADRWAEFDNFRIVAGC